MSTKNEKLTTGVSFIDESFNSGIPAKQQVKTVYGGRDLGYGYKKDNKYHFRSMVGYSLNRCRLLTKDKKLPKWDTEEIAANKFLEECK